MSSFYYHPISFTLLSLYLYWTTFPTVFFCLSRRFSPSWDSMSDDICFLLVQDLPLWTLAPEQGRGHCVSWLKAGDATAEDFWKQVWQLAEGLWTSLWDYLNIEQQCGSNKQGSIYRSKNDAPPPKTDNIYPSCDSQIYTFHASFFIFLRVSLHLFGPIKSKFSSLYFFLSILPFSYSPFPIFPPIFYRLMYPRWGGGGGFTLNIYTPGNTSSKDRNAYGDWTRQYIEVALMRSWLGRAFDQSRN